MYFLIYVLYLTHDNTRLVKILIHSGRY